ncbi:hypothetical protein [Hydrogenimonas cancrithermarum]|uniref:Uncharacterized protein n=1 Tax=Hydrogenimonas cancrithermarum TaxID=2993563 RepID=A0ABM8FNP7_9BACT|nr:hypothetical protein [Hydrogenimonas cancrithermarum]BDY13403.1 hypothetical protein HCR_17150 [Hydrogenimonas cancrithermarum]
MAFDRCDHKAKGAGHSPEATFKLFNEVKVPIESHPYGRSAFAPSFCWFSSTWLWPRLRRTAATGSKIASVTAYGDF